MSQKVDNLVQMLDTYVSDGGYHLNVNVFNRETLLDAQKHPEKYLPHTHATSKSAWQSISNDSYRQHKARKKHPHPLQSSGEPKNVHH